jgi:hypothetical protein
MQTDQEGEKTRVDGPARAHPAQEMGERDLGLHAEGRVREARQEDLACLGMPRVGEDLEDPRPPRRLEHGIVEPAPDLELAPYVVARPGRIHVDRVEEPVQGLATGAPVVGGEGELVLAHEVTGHAVAHGCDRIQERAAPGRGIGGEEAAVRDRRAQPEPLHLGIARVGGPHEGSCAVAARRRRAREEREEARAEPGHDPCGARERVAPGARFGIPHAEGETRATGPPIRARAAKPSAWRS